MKRKTTFSIALVLSVVLLSLMSSDSTAKAQQQVRCSVDTGIITLGPSRILRITIAAGLGGDPITFRFRQTNYQPITYEQGITSLAVESETTSAPITLAQNQAASLDLVATTYGRGMVLSNRRDAQVTVQLINAATDEILSFNATACPGNVLY